MANDLAATRKRTTRGSRSTKNADADEAEREVVPYIDMKDSTEKKYYLPLKGQEVVLIYTLKLER